MSDSVWTTEVVCVLTVVCRCAGTRNWLVDRRIASPGRSLVLVCLAGQSPEPSGIKGDLSICFLVKSARTLR